ncbi:MAG: hypothetical protein KDD47_28475, partial [Acidobacteria bacterium]|nr:hypothetical protein [Acidobacteriota bacterium]
ADPGQTFRHRVAWLPEVAAILPSPLPGPERGKGEDGFLEAASDGGCPDFLVGLGEAGTLEILSSDGSRVPDVPPLPLEQDVTPQKLLEFLRRLARFSNVRTLENSDEDSPKGPLSLELSLLPDTYEYPQVVHDEMVNDLPPVREVESGRWICLTIRNQGDQILHPYVLDLQPGWSIEVVYPQDEVELLERGKALHLPLTVYLPSGLEGRRNILKVFGTTHPTDFRFLSQPSLNKNRGAFRNSLGRPRTPLERLFAEIAQDGPKTRHGSTCNSGRQWTSAQVEFEIVKSD